MEQRQLTPIKAIRARCLDCCGYNVNEVKLCPDRDCSLYPYKLGKNPNIKRRELTPEEKEALRVQFAQNLAKKAAKTKD